LQDILITLVFTMTLFMFAIWPAVKIVDMIEKKIKLKEKVKNFLMLLFSIVIAFAMALFLQAS